MNIDAVRALEPAFRRAPSAHNTQPWTLTYHDDHVDIGWDADRTLPESDPSGRDLMLALGAFVECCLIACADAGLPITFEPAPAPGRIGRLISVGVPYETPYTIDDLYRRASHRGAYLPGPLDNTVSARITGLATAGGCRLGYLPANSANLLAREADRHLFSIPAVVAELRTWLRLTPVDPGYRHDGLTDKALGLSRFEARGLHLALAIYPVLRHFGLPRLLAAQTRFDDDGELFVLIGDPGAPVEAGRALLRIWLELARRGHATHPLSQLIDCPATRAVLADRLGVDDPAHLLHIARVGRPATVPAPSYRQIASSSHGNKVRLPFRS
ncbi:hypothetical protein AB0H76_03365 [Nocardia sp. NPDC050712]|uniref:hypothetical protein n=1 Tax=Nocardia sp. NPDC050712 TaxID=3155518 RepID=UPI0033CEF9F7